MSSSEQHRVSLRDFPGLVKTLRLGYDLGLAETPAASQAAELLERIALSTAAVAGSEMAQT